MEHRHTTSLRSTAGQPQTCRAAFSARVITLHNCCWLLRYKHSTVIHAQSQFSKFENGRMVSTNGVEGLFSRIKRFLGLCTMHGQRPVTACQITASGKWEASRLPFTTER
eukprot:2787138-Amphidinium_carterae.1